ncbi:MAG: glycerophosphodiester phosphodiesterase family protein [Anaerorhabdus sp.]
MIFISILILLLLFILYSVLGTNKHAKSLESLNGIYYHRGFYDNKKIAENSMKAFEKCINKGYGIELDVQLTKDKQVVVFHDDDLKRMSNSSLIIKETTYDDLLQFNLLNTMDKIPLFEDVLKLNHGTVPIYIEIKDFSMNFKELVNMTLQLMEKYPGNYYVCSFNVIAIIYLRKLNPKILRGVISQNFKNEKYPKFLGFILQNMFLNFLAKPDIISYGYNEINWSVRLNKLFKRTLAGWAIENQEKFDEYKNFYDIQVIELFEPK